MLTVPSPGISPVIGYNKCKNNVRYMELNNSNRGELAGNIACALILSLETNALPLTGTGRRTTWEDIISREIQHYIETGAVITQGDINSLG